MHNRIKTVRESLNLSQKEFGEKLGVSRDVISNLEYDRVSSKELLLRHICEVYGVNESWLLNGAGEMFSRDPVLDKKLEEAVELFKNLKPEFQDYVLAQLKNLLDLQNGSF